MNINFETADFIEAGSSEGLLILKDPTTSSKWPLIWLSVGIAVSMIGVVYYRNKFKRLKQETDDSEGI